MDRASIIDMMQSRITTPVDFNYDRLQGPPILSLISIQDTQDLHYIATSVKYSGKPRKKYKAIDDIMKARGFSKLGAGTNRVVYRYLDDDRFVFKIAIDDIGMKDNPREFQNQIILKPFCAKTFEVDPTGTVACSERVQAITNREEFELIANDVYDLITTYIIGKYIMADIGTLYFMNFGIRKGCGPVLLDYTYLYELDGNKLHCTEPDPQDPSKPCGGIIDYDAGFNKLYCQKCGHWYRVQELAKMPEFKDIINRRSETKMDVIIRRGSTIQHVGEDKEIILPGSTAKIQKPEKEENYASTIQVKPVKKISVPNRNQQTHYQQKKSEPVKPRFETKTDEEFKLKQNKGTGYKKEEKPQYNNNIQRGVVRTTEPVTTDAESKFPIPQPSKKKAPHFKRLSYNPKFKTITMYDNSNDRYVLELGEHDEIIQQIVDGSDYFKNVMSMKQSAFDTLKKNNTDLNIENEKLTSDNKTLFEENQKLQKKVTDLSSDKGLEQAQQRIQELEQQVLDLKEKINSVSDSDKNKVPEYGKEEESFNESKYPRVMFTNGEVTTLKKLGRVKNNEDDHKVIMLSDDGDINSAASDDQGNLVLIVSINGILVDKYNQLKEAEIVDENAKDEQKEDDEN